MLTLYINQEKEFHHLPFKIILKEGDDFESLKDKICKIYKKTKEDIEYIYDCETNIDNVENLYNSQHLDVHWKSNCFINVVKYDEDDDEEYRTIFLNHNTLNELKELINYYFDIDNEVYRIIRLKNKTTLYCDKNVKKLENDEMLLIERKPSKKEKAKKYSFKVKYKYGDDDNNNIIYIRVTEVADLTKITSHLIKTFSKSEEVNHYVLGYIKDKNYIVLSTNEDLKNYIYKKQSKESKNHSIHLIFFLMPYWKDVFLLQKETYKLSTKWHPTDKVNHIRYLMY